jgi:hypothetical protein
MRSAPMSFCRTHWLCAAVTAFAQLAWQSGTRAEDVIFTIDSSQSSETWSGIDNTYGAIQPQSSNSLMTAVEGHFVVDFDPTTDNPTSIQFIDNNNNGYFQLDNAGQNFAPGGAPANVAGTVAGGQSVFAIQNLIWDLNSPVINGTGGTFPATTTSFTVSSGGIAYAYPRTSPQFSSYVASTGTLSAGAWTLAESQPGSGDWRLTMNGTYTYGFNSGVTSGTLTATANVVATAHFGAANLTSVPSGPAEAQILGGAGATGGVTIDFGQNSTGGPLSIQQVPGITALTPAAIAAGQSNPIFALSTSDTSIGAPQIWSVNYGGSLSGGSATLVFHYDPSQLPAGTDQSSLGIWHFDKNANQWEFGGTVNTTDHTISFVTSSFSPFQLGVRAVPEPSTIVLAALGGLALLACRWRR